MAEIVAGEDVGQPDIKSMSQMKPKVDLHQKHLLLL